MEQIKEKLTELLQAKFDKEYNDIGMLLSEAYVKGVHEGTTSQYMQSLKNFEEKKDETTS